VGVWRNRGSSLRRERQAVVTRCAPAHADGGWSVSSLGQYKRADNTPLDTVSDGATGLVAYALQRAGVGATDARVSRAIGWLVEHGTRDGQWTASSLNKQRDPETDIGSL
jgi:hypothetical protein